MTSPKTSLSKTAAPRGRGLQVDWSRGLLPLSLLILFVLRFGFDAPTWLLIVFMLWIPAFYFAFPRYMRRRWYHFDKEFAARFQKGDFKGLLLLYRDQWMLRKFGPRAEMLGKLGLIYAAMHRYREAEEALEKALDHAHFTQRDKLFFNLAGVKYELGHYEEAEQILKALRANSPYGHTARTHLALIDLRCGRRPEQARQFLQTQRDQARGDVKARIERALAES